MIFKQVTLEFVTLVSVANVSAETGADAVIKAGQLVDSKSLLERHIRNPHPNSPEGTVLNIVSSSFPTAAAAYFDHNEQTLAGTFEIDDDLTVKSSDVIPKSILSRILRDSALLLVNAVSTGNDQEIVDVAKSISNAYLTAGLINAPMTPEEVIEGAVPDAKPDYFENIDMIYESNSGDEGAALNLPERISNLILEKVSSLDDDGSLPNAFKMSANIFVSPASEENASNGFNWQIEFGEIEVEYNGEKIAAIGTWKKFANPNIAYFEDPSDFSQAQNAILEMNNTPRLFIEKPSIAGKIESMFSVA